MITLLLIILFYFVKSPFSLNLYRFLQDSDDSGYEKGENFIINLLTACLPLYSYDFRNMTICMVNETKYDVEGLYYLLENPSIYKRYYPLLDLNEKFKIYKPFLELLEQDAKNQSQLIGYIIKAINCTDPSETNVLDYVINILKIKPLNLEYMFTNLSKIFQNEEINSTLDYLYNYHFDDVMEVIKVMAENNTRINRTVHIIIDNMGPNTKKLAQLIYKIIQVYGDRKNIVILIEQYFLELEPEVFPKMRNIILSKELKMIFKELTDLNNDYLNAMKDVVFDRPEILDIIFNIASHKQLIPLLADILINFDNKTYFGIKFADYLIRLKAINNSYIDQVAKAMFYMAEYAFRYKAFEKVLLAGVQKVLRDLLYKGEILSYNISPECIYLFNHTFLENQDMDPIFLNYLKKLFLESPINVGDFLNYDNCLSIGGTVANLNESQNPFHIKPAFVISIVECIYSRNLFKNTSFYEKYYYISNFCLPYGLKMNSTEKMCDDDDYNKIMQFIAYFYSNYSNITVETITLLEDNISLNSTDNFYGYFTLIFLCTPFIIRIVLFGFDISHSKKKKNEKINKLISLKDKGKDKIDKISIEPEKAEKNIFIAKKKESKCFKILKESLAFIKNLNELFNFSLDNKNFNNTKGITFIKGLIGLSIILNIFGQTFIILLNLPMKEFGIEQFHSSLTNWIFPLIFIGYRYSPRILFSCSGYTLIYKYLCYIEQEGGYYFLKFVYLQSYKYILLYIFLYIFAYLFKFVIFVLMQTKRPIWYLFDYYLKKDKNLFLKSITFLLFDMQNKTSKQNPINFFYMPINEIFFFIIGTVLISLGYKYKWRIDLIIIGAIIFLFISKLIIYLSYIYPTMKLYSTTDYYYDEFGLALINPIYNLPSFLIGMYFGLINYSIQKGITQIYKTDKDYYKNIIPLKNSDEEQEKININNNNMIIKNINEDVKGQSINDINEENNENLEKIISKENINTNINNIKKNKEHSEKNKNIPFLISAVNFINFNRNNKDKIYFNILIIIAILFFIFLIYSKNIFIAIFSYLDLDLVQEEYFARLSLINTIAKESLNILYLLDIEIVVFLTQWIIFLLFFKETQIIRNFFNNRIWSFFVKCYYSYILLSAPIILIIFYLSESVVKVHSYNIIFFSMINITVVCFAVIIYYTCYELPVKKIFKYFLKGDEIIEEENDDEDEDEEEQEEDKEEEFFENNDDEDENQILKQDN